MISRHTNPPPRFGLYLHIPVCLAKCSYCDFVSYARDLLGFGQMDRLVQALHTELELALQACPDLRGRPLDSIYFGGGTPSLLPPDAIGSLIQAARKVFAQRLVPEAFPVPAASCRRSSVSTPSPQEITLECNPVGSEIERLSAYREAGVTRISLGVQSFQPKILKSLGRLHSADEARAAITRIQSLDFASWGFDLIFGTPESSLDQWKEDLEEAIQIQPPHLSVYGLTLHEGTPLFERHVRGEITLPDEETQREMFLMARRMLTQAEWRHYEISNYAKPAHESRHNSLYWTGGEYLGLGVSAHSCFAGRRRANPSELNDYLKQVESGTYPAITEPCPSLRSQRAERIMLALRQLDGFDPQQLSHEIGCNFSKEYSAEIEALVEQGWLLVSPKNVKLSEEGILLSDQVFEAFF